MPGKRNHQQENYRRHWKSKRTLSDIVIFQTLKYVQDMSDFNTISNPTVIWLYLCPKLHWWFGTL